MRVRTPGLGLLRSGFSGESGFNRSSHVPKLVTNRYPMGYSGSSGFTNRYPMGYTGNQLVTNNYPFGYVGNDLKTNNYPMGYISTKKVINNYPMGYISGQVTAAVLAVQAQMLSTNPSSSSVSFADGVSVYVDAQAWIYRAGTEMDFTRLTLGNSIDNGWNWSAVFPYEYDAKPDPIEQIWTIVIDDGLGGYLVSPPLHLLTASGPTEDSVGGPTTNISGCDMTTWRQSRDAEDFDTFQYTNSTDIVAILAARNGVTINGVPVFPVISDDAKQAQLSDVLGRIKGVMAYESVIDESGAINLTPWEQVGGQVAFDYTTFSPGVARQDSYTSIYLGKRSALGGGTAVDPTSGLPVKNPDIPFKMAGTFSQKLAVPLQDCIAEQTSDSVGYIELVEYWNGVPNQGGHLIDIQFVEATSNVYPSVFKTGVPPITYITYNVFPPANQVGNLSTDVNGIMTLTGTPYALVDPTKDPTVTKAAGADTGFEYLYDTLATPVRRAHDWVDPLHPNKATAIARAPYILAQKNQHGFPASMEGTLQVSNALKSTTTRGSVKWKLHEFLHTFDNTAGRTTHLDFTYVSG